MLRVVTQGLWNGRYF